MSGVETRTPLSWPRAVPRTPAGERRRAAYGKQAPHGGGEPLTLAQAVERLSPQVARLARQRGMLALDALPDAPTPPRDPGAVLAFGTAGATFLIPCDTWDRAADNVAALAAHLEAVRAASEHGVASPAALLESFRVAARPDAPRAEPAAPPAPNWARVLGVAPDAEPAVVRAAYRALAKRYHPDNGGDTETMRRLNDAWQAYAGEG